MRRLHYFFNGLFVFLRRFKRSKPEAIPKQLPAEALAKAMAEARFLFAHHGVEVRVLAPGEKAGGPRPADGSALPPGFTLPSD